MALSSALLPDSARTTTTGEQLNRCMTLKIKSQLHLGSKDMQTNQTQENKNRGSRLQREFGKRNAAHLGNSESLKIVAPS